MAGKVSAFSIIFSVFLVAVPPAFSIHWRGTREAFNASCLRQLVIPHLEARVSQEASPVWLGRSFELERLLRYTGVPEIRAKNLVAEVQRFAVGNHGNRWAWINSLVQDALRGVQLAQEDPEFLVCALGQGCTLRRSNGGIRDVAELYYADDFLLADPRIHTTEELRLEIERDPSIRAGLGRFAGVMTLPHVPAQVDASDAAWVDTFYHEMTHYYERRLLRAWIEANRKLIRDGQSPDELFRTYSFEVSGITVLDSVFFHTFAEARAHAVGIYAGLWIAGRNVARFRSAEAERFFPTRTPILTLIMNDILMSQVAGEKFDPSENYPELHALGTISAIKNGDEFMNEQGIDVTNVFAKAVTWTAAMKQTILRAGLPIP